MLMAHVCNPTTREAEIRRLPGQIVLKTPSSKITKAKLTGGVAQALQCLIYKHHTLSSNPSPTKVNNLNNVFLNHLNVVINFKKTYTLGISQTFITVAKYSTETT
jgi:hypothetical protein